MIQIPHIDYRQTNIVNPDDRGSYDRLFVVVGFAVVLGAAYADSLQDALDTLANCGNLEDYRAGPGYFSREKLYLGNHAEGYDMHGTGVYVEYVNQPAQLAQPA